MCTFLTPLQVTERVIQLGQRIRVARIRRSWSVADLASTAGINRNTLTALELCKPGTAVGVCFTVLWALGLDRSLDAMAYPDRDLHGKALEASRRPAREARPARRATTMTSEREAYVYMPLPGTLETEPAALLRVQTLPDGTQIGRFRYGDRDLQRQEAVAINPTPAPISVPVIR